MAFIRGIFQTFRVVSQFTIGRPSGQGGILLRVGDVVKYDGVVVEVVKTGKSFENASLATAIDAGFLTAEASVSGVFDIMAGPSLWDKSLKDALAEAEELTTAIGRTVTVGLKPGAGPGYISPFFEWPASVNLWTPNGSDGAQIDGEVRVLTGGRRRLDGGRLTNTQGGATLLLSPTATATTLCQGVSLRNDTNADPCVDSTTANSVLITDALQAVNLFPSPVSSIRATAGSISIEGNSFITHGDFDTPCIDMQGGSLFIRRIHIENPVNLAGSAFAQVEQIIQDAYQVGRIGTAWMIGAGCLLRIRRSTIYNTDGVANAAFDGTGTFEYTGFDCPQLTGTLFDAGLTVVRQLEREGTIIP